MNKKLLQELNAYLDSKVQFPPYHKSMKHILCSSLFEEQLQEIITGLQKEDSMNAKNFKLYLDTVIINMQSKIAKYKLCAYFENENVKEIENQGYIIPFYSDEGHETYVLLGIYKKDDLS